ncbi:unc-93 homolog A2 isoform X1 [Mus musculus]|uniref:Protein unc-93 homolog A n=1 Tax=Mus musculus TaxID=10090 RepID=B2RWK3_MOUSE|nr:unc-93 homolog A2 [Mus musculus]XP_006523305.1 unc-93 homolog A2 isoform X1 [Mus musculus]XP_006523306.1 unc-93 homolog A2 isoform X1 [Mus musculus]XP_006523307.1 unc-93 homolog A2 isoform X1 [Mus musculus]XP_011244481.1 unc-93 homolog A2 isoform X1 [Mus musculus]XP_030105852.1 unc-93 homolog A2 isoform X1 [Mus musculus]XP_036016637.1 unc-93 homolog A2 isoform X1 [Mus musculus]AAI47831.1 Unc-93 homolog A (C. elegans) [Mus musculus]|eukprot:NP_001136011.1 predicted gene, ENSMUSG00000056133 [Mus musculus]
MERSLKNVLVVSCGFLLLFTAYGGLQNLQSSLYSEQGLGVATLSTLYASVLLSSMFLPPILIKKCGCKWTIVGSMCCYVVFSLGNFHANWYTLIPTSILLGLGAAPLWSAQGTYLTTMGNLQAEKVGKLGKDVVNQYFGIFFLVFQSSGVWGNLISSLVFGKMSMQEAIPEEQLMSCGAKDCLMGPAATNSTHHPSQQLIYTLLGIYTGCGVLAILLVAVFLESLEDKLENEGERRPRPPPLWSTLLSTFMLFRDKRLCLLMFLPLYSGFQQEFLSGEYTKSYVTCALGIHFVGYVMICFSAMTALCSLLYGKISKYTGRAALYALGAAIHFSCVVVFLLWHPNTNQLPVFFVLSGLWGMSDAVWQTQNNALFGVLFEENKEPAFANYRLGEAIGFVIAFGYSSFLCVSTKLYILLGVLSLAMVGYGTVEYLEVKAASKVLGAEKKNQAEEEEMKTKM